MQGTGSTWAVCVLAQRWIWHQSCHLLAADVFPCCSTPAAPAGGPPQWGVLTLRQKLSSFAVCPQSFSLFLLQARALHQQEAAIAAWQIMPICMCLEATILTMMSLVGQRTKTTHSSGSSGGTTLLQTRGTKWALRATCPGSWPLCHVRMEIQFLCT